MNVGFIGIGVMGGCIARNIIDGGKSSTLKVVCGLVRTDGGTIRVPA